MTYSSSLIDTHAHLTCDTVYGQIDSILERAKESGIEKIVNICTDLTSFERGISLQKTYPWIYCSAATTPHDVETEGKSFFPVVEKAAYSKQIVAIGETGLDYHYQYSPKVLQQEFLIRYFDLARASSLPLIFHCRDAFDDLFALSDIHYRGSPALLHCFTGSKAEAKGVLDRGWLLSFSGIVTFKKSIALRDIAGYVPLDRLVLETDTPYLAPQSKRGKINEPSWIIETAEAIASIRQIPYDLLAEQTKQNAMRFFSF